MHSPDDQIELRLARMEAKQDQLNSDLKWLLQTQAGLDQRLARVEDSIVFRTLRAIGRFYQTRIAKKKAGTSSGYAEWVRRAGMDFAAAVTPRVQPSITVRIMVRRPDRQLLERAIGSVREQTYARWELAAEFGSDAPPWARELFGPAAATGEWVASLDENDFLSPVALEHFAAAVQDGSPDLVYSDGDIVDDEGRPLRPLFKPDWSPVLMRSVPYVDGLRMERAGLTGEPKNVVHVSKVLYHARDGAPVPTSRDRERASPALTVSIIVCTRNNILLRRCLTGLRDRTEYPNKHVIVVRHLGSSSSKEEHAVAAVATEFGATAVSFTQAFNFSTMNNLGARSATGDLLLFLNDDVDPIATDWLSRMAAHLQDPTIGAVGAKLLYPSGAIQHAGIATWLIDGAGHPGRNLFSSENWPWLNHTREVTAVTGACLAIRRADFEHLGGFDPMFPVNYNDVDLCLRLRAAGFTVIVEADAVLRHDESQTRKPGTQYDERRLFFNKWSHVVGKVDPFYSPHLAQNNEDLSLR